MLTSYILLPVTGSSKCNLNYFSQLQFELGGIHKLRFAHYLPTTTYPLLTYSFTDTYKVKSRIPLTSYSTSPCQRS